MPLVHIALVEGAFTEKQKHDMTTVPSARVRGSGSENMTRPRTPAAAARRHIWPSNHD
jgi:hypothetical protein